MQLYRSFFSENNHKKHNFNLMNLGITPEMDIEEVIRIRSLNLGSISCFAICIFYGILTQDSPAYIANLAILFIFTFIGWVGNFLGYHSFSQYFIPCAVTVMLTSISICIGPKLGAEYYLIIIFISILSHLNQNPMFVLWAMFPVFCFILTKLSHTYYGAFFSPPALMPYLYVVNISLPFFICFLILRDFLKKHTEYKQQLLENNLILEKKKEDLSHSNDIKNKLFSILAHDLRAPLKSVSGFLTLLEGNYLSEQEKNDCINKLEISLNSSSDMLDNLLLWATQQQTMLQTNLQKVDIHVLFEEKISFFILLAKQKNIELSYKVAPKTLVLADSHQISFVIRNLVANAIKFTQKGGNIRLEVAENGEKSWKISISDTGLGIKPENIPLILDKKHHFTTIGTAREKGTGIGLPLCKEFIENHGSELLISSKEGEGSCFFFSLAKFQQAS